jgi:hypothetical protein
MKTLQSSRVVTVQQQTDQQMLDFLRDKLAEKYKEGGGNRHYSDAIIARFAELIENQTAFRRSLETIQDAHKLAMAQMQFAQTVVHQLENQVERLEKIEHRNGKSLPSPAVDLQGE